MSTSSSPSDDVKRRLFGGPKQIPFDNEHPTEASTLLLNLFKDATTETLAQFCVNLGIEPTDNHELVAKSLFHSFTSKLTPPDVAHVTTYRLSKEVELMKVGQFLETQQLALSNVVAQLSSVASSSSSAAAAVTSRPLSYAAAVGPLTPISADALANNEAARKFTDLCAEEEHLNRNKVVLTGDGVAVNKFDDVHALSVIALQFQMANIPKDTVDTAIVSATPILYPDPSSSEMSDQPPPPPCRKIVLALAPTARPALFKAKQNLKSKGINLSDQLGPSQRQYRKQVLDKIAADPKHYVSDTSRVHWKAHRAFKVNIDPATSAVLKTTPILPSDDALAALWIRRRTAPRPSSPLSHTAAASPSRSAPRHTADHKQWTTAAASGPKPGGKPTGSFPPAPGPKPGGKPTGSFPPAPAPKARVA
jgi:hypothetical protein